jgi:hypothetical protein
MAWTQERLAELPTVQGFRMRGENMTRLEVFSDAAFAFAMTMLVVSVGNIPQSHSDLILALKAAPAFGLSFALLAWYWSYHRKWSRQFGLEDGISSILTLLMVFIILVYVYPLKLMFSSFCHFISAGWLPSEYKVDNAEQIADLFIIYGVGSAALSGVISALYWHAKRRTSELSLNHLELALTSRNCSVWLTHSVFGAISAAFAACLPISIAVYAGFIYFGMGAAIPVVYLKYGKPIRSAELLDQEAYSK